MTRRRTRGCIRGVWRSEEPTGNQQSRTRRSVRPIFESRLQARTEMGIANKRTLKPDKTRQQTRYNWRQIRTSRLTRAKEDRPQLTYQAWRLSNSMLRFEQSGHRRPDPFQQRSCRGRLRCTSTKERRQRSHRKVGWMDNAARGGNEDRRTGKAGGRRLTHVAKVCGSGCGSGRGEGAHRPRDTAILTLVAVLFNCPPGIPHRRQSAQPQQAKKANFDRKRQVSPEKLGKIYSAIGIKSSLHKIRAVYFLAFACEKAEKKG